MISRCKNSQNCKEEWSQSDPEIDLKEGLY